MAPYSGRNKTLRWAASDSSYSFTTLRYDVEARVGRDGLWKPLYTNTGKTEGTYSGKNGQEVYFRVRATDGFGNVNAWPTEPDLITFDTLPPTGIVDISFVGAGSVQALVSADDNLSGVSQMRVGRRDTIGSALWQPFAQTVTVSRSGAPADCLELRSSSAT